jgi:hypothetical protein
VPKSRIIFKNCLHLSVGTFFEGRTNFGLLEGKSGTTAERVRFVLGFGVDYCNSQHKNDSSGAEYLHSDPCCIAFSKDRICCQLLPPFTRDLCCCGETEIGKFSKV